MFLRTIAAAILLSTAALAAEPALNDLPLILKKLRGCVEQRGILSTETVCKIESKDLWVAVNSEGDMTLFRQRSYGDTIYARGHTVTELLRDFAAKLNTDSATNKSMVDAMAPYLPSQ